MCRVFSCLARLALSLIFIAITMPCVALGANEIGKVIMYTPGATVQRDGKTEPLALHAGIRVSDTLQTDAGGRVKVLFNDDSSVSLGPNTTMDMNEYADAGSKSAFSVNVPQGMIRAITGKITEQNPSGFKVTSPEATVGIRGTIVTMQVHRGQGGRMHTTVFVENTLRRVYVNNDNVPTGNKWIREDGASRQERISPEDRRHIGKTMAFRGGNGVAAAAPEATGERTKRSRTERFVAARPDELFPPDTSLKDIALSTQTLGDSLLLASSAPMGHVSGSMSSSVIGGGLAAFGFDVNLSNGNISNGYLNTNYPIMYISSLRNGSGLASPSGFSMNVSGTWIDGMGMIHPGSHGQVSGSSNLLGMASGSTVSPVTYDIQSGADSGSGSGTFTKK